MTAPINGGDIMQKAVKWISRKNCLFCETPLELKKLDEMEKRGENRKNRLARISRNAWD